MDNFNVIIEKYNISNVEPLNKVWSKDSKYILTDTNNKKYLLRVSDISLENKRKSQFQFLQKLTNLDINCSKVIEVGYLNNSVYMLLTWVNGKPAEEEVSKMNDIEAYNLGLEAGEILRKIHSIEIEKQDLSWWDKYQVKLPKKIKAYKESILKHKNSECLLKYYKDNAYLMENRPQVFSHGDYHLGNMVVDNGRIGIIDFDKNNPADPYDEFKPYCWNVRVNEYFETGLINGYFNNEIPEDFFKILKYYTIESLISHLPWAQTFGDAEVKTAYEIADMVFEWYDDFKLEVPTWYKGILN